VNQQYLNVVSKFEEGASDRKIMYDKMQMIEGWIASLRPPPSQQPLSEEVGSFYP